MNNQDRENYNRNLPVRQDGPKYPTDGAALDTQDANQPVIPVRDIQIVNKTIIRTVDRSPKDILTWRTSLIAAESVYYPNQSRLFDLYEDAILDGHLSGIIQKRIDQVLNKTLQFKVGDDVEEAMNPTIRSQAMRGIITEFMWRKLRGLAGLEFVPGEKLAYNLIPPKHIKLKTQMITYEQFGLTDGVSYTDAKNILVLGDHHDFGLLLKCAYYALLKKGAVTDWATYIELFGSPVIVLKYDGYNKDDKQAGEKILANSGNSQKILIPRTMDWDMKDGKISNGDGKLQETFRLAMNQEMSLIILGNTETSASGQHGSEGKSKTHSDQQKEIMKSDMEYILDCLNSPQFLQILKSYNLPVDGGCFEYDREVDVTYLAQKMPIDIAWATAGLPISKRYIYETYAIPEPEDAADTFTYTGGQEDEDAGEKPPQGGKPKPTKPKKPKPVTAQLTDNAPATIADVKALLSAFFGPARS